MRDVIRLIFPINTERVIKFTLWQHSKNERNYEFKFLINIILTINIWWLKKIFFRVKKNVSKFNFTFPFICDSWTT